MKIRPVSPMRSTATMSRPAMPRWIAAALFLLCAAPAHAQIDILTNRYDGQRTGANLSETTLTTANVNVSQFGKLYSYPVDGSVYAQPLYVRGVVINGTPHNVLYVATMNDKLYAFDADSSSPTPLWIRDFTSPPSVTAVPVIDIVGANNLNIVGNVGIHSTPVIDPESRTIYLVARTKENGAYFQRLHALDIATGASRAGSPVTITGSVPGTASDSTFEAGGQVITFNPKMQSQRAGLALTNGVVLIAWASHEDRLPYHGWIMGYDKTSLAKVATISVTPDVDAGGIWQGGRAPTLDAAGNAYFATGNALWDGTRNFGDSLLKFSVSRTAGLTRLDYFTPSNQEQLNLDDDDLSGSGFTLLPGTNLLLGGGKEGVLYLLDANNLGKLVAKDTQIKQRIPVTGGHVMGGPVYWNSTTQGPLIYNWSEDDALKAYRFQNNLLTLPAYAQGTVLSPGHPGGSLTLSANGSAAGTGIVWASMPTSQDGIHGKVAGILRAYDAETLTELWNADQNPTRDRVGTLMKFVPPVVVNGRVYLPNHDGTVAVYGLLPAPAPNFSVSATPGSRTIAPGASGTFAVTVSAQGGFTGTVTLSATGQPSGTTVSFSPASIPGSGTSTMTVSVPASAPAGSFSITATGTSGTLVRSAPPVVVTTGSAAAGSIGINFIGSSPTPMAATETAGVVPQPNWNNAPGASRSTPLALVDRAGAATSATVTWSAVGGTWQTPIADSAGNARMMKGYLDNDDSTTTTVTVAGLAQQTYDVYVYADGDNKVYERGAAYTISGTGITATTVNLTDAPSTNFAGTFTQAADSRGNYVKFRITAAGFSVKAAPTTPSVGTRRAPINGIQIVPAASPSPDFAISVSPATRSVAQGASTTYTATITPQNGFTGTVSLAATGAPSGTTTTFSPGSVSGSGTATLTVTTSSSTPAGSSTLTIRGTSGTLSHTATATLTVTAAPPAGGSIGINFIGSSPTPMAAAETAGVVAQPNWNNASGASRSTPLPLVDRAGTATSATVTWSAVGGTWQTPVTDSAGNARMMKGYLDNDDSTTTTVTVAGLDERSYDIYVYADGDNKVYERSASYTISGAGITTTTINLTDAPSTNFAGTFTQAANSKGNYVKFSITATGFSILAQPTTPAVGTRRAPINGIQIVPTTTASPDFTISVSPASRSVTQGGSTTYTATVGALNGFSGTVSLAATGAPSGATATFSPASVGGSGTATLTVATSSSTPAGTSTLTIKGTSGSSSHTDTVTLDVTALPPSAGAIGIDFVGNSTTTMAAADSAGVVPKANWNSAAGAARSTPLPLVDESGRATGATVTWAANGGWMLPITDAPGNRRLMRGYLDTSTTSVTTISVAGLPSGAYDVYVYVDGDNHEFTRTAGYRISGTGITATTITATDPANTDFSGTFTEAAGTSGNYVKFTIDAAGFTLTATPGTGTNATLRAPVNAIQIVPR